MRRRWAVANAAAILISSGALLQREAGAGEYSYTLSYGADYTDNATLVATNEKHDVIHTASAGFSISQLDRELETRGNFNTSYLAYQNNSFADELSFGANEALIWKPLPEAFHWAVDDVYTQVAANPTAPDTPSNRVNTNIFSTGPDIFWRLSPVHTLQFGGRYALNSFSNTANTAGAGADADNKRGTGTVQWLYRPTPVTTLSLGYLAESVRFDDPGVGTNLDFRRKQVSAGFSNKVARNTLALNLGEARIDREGQPEIRGTIGSLSWLREISSDSSFSLSASRSLSDAAEELLGTAGGTTPPLALLAPSTSDIFVSKIGNATYARRFGSRNFTITAFRTERTFRLSPANDEIAKGGNIVLTQTFTDTLVGNLTARYTKTRFPTVPRDDKDRGVALGLQYKFTRTVSAGLGVARQSRSSTDPTADFTENRIAVNVSYISLPNPW